MAVKNIAGTDTLETFRTKFNELAANDFGDAALLAPAGISATSVVGAVIELSAQIGTGEGHYIRDASSTVQLIAPGNTISFLGTSNQITATVSSPDTVTLAFPTNVTVTNLTVNGTLNGQSITFPSATGEIITTGSIDLVSESMMADDAIGSAQMKTLSTLLIKNSSGATLKTVHGAGV
tara:strand:- start:1173 stop:1709 length:537 start_codon:yes stop_codon:yes gene_type:complete